MPRIVFQEGKDDIFNFNIKLYIQRIKNKRKREKRRAEKIQGRDEKRHKYSHTRRV